MECCSSLGAVETKHGCVNMKIKPMTRTPTKDCTSLSLGLKSDAMQKASYELWKQMETYQYPFQVGSHYISVTLSACIEEFKIDTNSWWFYTRHWTGGLWLFFKEPSRWGTRHSEGYLKYLSFPSNFTWGGSREAHIPLTVTSCSNCWIFGWVVNLIAVCHVLLNWSPIEQ